MKLSRRFRIEWAWMFALIPPLLFWLHHQPGALQVNYALYDRLVQWQAPAPAPDILIIGIDARSLRELGPWPWPRSTHAQLLDRLALHAPRSVLLDLFLDRPTEDDARLAEAMAALPVYLPRRPEAVYRGPVPLLLAQARGSGHAIVTPDADGTVRRLRSHEGPANNQRPYVGMMLAASTAPQRIPATFGLPFSGPAGSYRTVPYVSVLNGEVPDELLRGRDLLVGAVQDAGLGDQVTVRLGQDPALLPGIEVHANAIDALRQGHVIAFPEGLLLAAWIALPVWLSLLLFLRSARQALLAACGVAALSLGASAVLLAFGRIWLPPFIPLVGIALAYILWSWRRLAALLGFLRRRIDALNAIPAGAFELPAPAFAGLDDIDRKTAALDHAVHRLTQLQSLLSEGLWHMPAAVLLCREDGRILQGNAAAGLLMAPNAAQPDALSGRNLLHALASMKKTELTGLPAGTPADHWERADSYEYITPRERVLRLRSTVIPGRTDAIAGIRVAVLRDLTIERRAEQERAQWLGFLSHDLRSPQVTILSLLALHAEREPSALADERLLAAIQREAERTLAMSEGFVDVMEAESTEYRFADIEAAAVALDAVEQAMPLGELRGITLLPPELGEHDAVVRADGALLQRALFNLINNALRHSAPGSTVRVSVDVAQQQVVITVADEGEGMGPEQLAQLLAARASPLAPSGHDATSPARRRGIGFTVVRAVVHRHGGWLDAQSAAGKGTTIRIGLPLLVHNEESDDASFTSGPA